MALTDQEKTIIAWYRSLSVYQRLLLNGWLMTGDGCLLVYLGRSVFSRQLHEFLEVATPEGR